MMLKAADLFCGAGGTSAGARDSGAVKVTFALNHWDVAVKTHSANFPEAKHVNSRLDMTHPSECGKIDLLFASPECTHHSNARGGRPMEDQKRAGAWDVLKWVEHHRPSWVVIENVREFKSWGPLNNGRPMKSGLGKFFDAWLMAIRAAGYQVDHQMLNAADFGAATSRDRLFVIARKGNRNPRFPEPSHSKTTGNSLPGMDLHRWRSAAEIIDWQLPCPSIFSRKRPLADKTLRRIEMGLRKFVGPFVAQWDQTGGNGNYVRSVSDPLYTLVTKSNTGLVVPFQVRFRNNMDATAITEPIGTLTAGGGHNGVALPFLVQRQGFYDCHRDKVPRDLLQPVPSVTASHIPGGVAVPYLVPNFGEAPGQTPRTHDVSDSLPTVTSHGAGGLALPYLVDTNHGKRDCRLDRSYPISSPMGVSTKKRGKGICVPFLAHYYGTNNISLPSDPLDTITAKERHGLILPELGTHVPDWQAIQQWESEGGAIGETFTPAMLSLLATMSELGVVDIGFRMLGNHELALAQGFGSEYRFHGTKSDVTRQIGNSVSPNVAKAISQAIAG